MCKHTNTTNKFVNRYREDESNNVVANANAAADDSFFTECRICYEPYEFDYDDDDDDDGDDKDTKQGGVAAATNTGSARSSSSSFPCQGTESINPPAPPNHARALPKPTTQHPRRVALQSSFCGHLVCQACVIYHGQNENLLRKIPRKWISCPLCRQSQAFHPDKFVVSLAVKEYRSILLVQSRLSSLRIGGGENTTTHISHHSNHMTSDTTTRENDGTVDHHKDDDSNAASNDVVNEYDAAVATTIPSPFPLLDTITTTFAHPSTVNDDHIHNHLKDDGANYEKMTTKNDIINIHPAVMDLDNDTQIMNNDEENTWQPTLAHQMTTLTTDYSNMRRETTTAMTTSAADDERRINGMTLRSRNTSRQGTVGGEGRMMLRSSAANTSSMTEDHPNITRLQEGEEEEASEDDDRHSVNGPPLVKLSPPTYQPMDLGMLNVARPYSITETKRNVTHSRSTDDAQLSIFGPSCENSNTKRNVNDSAVDASLFTVGGSVVPGSSISNSKRINDTCSNPHEQQKQAEKQNCFSLVTHMEHVIGTNVPQWKAHQSFVCTRNEDWTKQNDNNGNNDDDNDHYLYDSDSDSDNVNDDDSDSDNDNDSDSDSDSDNDSNHNPTMTTKYETDVMASFIPRSAPQKALEGELQSAHTKDETNQQSDNNERNLLCSTTDASMNQSSSPIIKTASKMTSPCINLIGTTVTIHHRSASTNNRNNVVQHAVPSSKPPPALLPLSPSPLRRQHCRSSSTSDDDEPTKIAPMSEPPGCDGRTPYRKETNMTQDNKQQRQSCGHPTIPRDLGMLPHSVRRRSPPSIVTPSSSPSFLLSSARSSNQETSISQTNKTKQQQRPSCARSLITHLEHVTMKPSANCCHDNDTHHLQLPQMVRDMKDHNKRGRCEDPVSNNRTRIKRLCMQEWNTMYDLLLNELEKGKQNISLENKHINNYELKIWLAQQKINFDELSKCQQTKLSKLGIFA